MRPRLLFVVNDANFFLSHRLPLALTARKEGYDVAVACPVSSGVIELAKLDVRHVPLPLPRGKIALLAEIRAFIGLWRILKRERPDLVHLITAKPVIYGGILTRWLKIRSVAAVSGLGHVFVDMSLKNRLLRIAALLGYRWALRRQGLFPIFQNDENRKTLASFGATFEHPTLIRGSGADLARFDPAPSDNEIPRVVLPSRMILTKGIAEFVEAANLLLRQGIKAKFTLVGEPDPDNPASISTEQLEAWTSQGAVSWIGYRADIEAILQQSDLVALPSYYGEGLPKTLVDAAAAGRAVVTTDTAGCRDTVIPGQTALLCRPMDARDLAEKMRRLILNRDLRLALGAAGRRLAEREFGHERIVRQHLDLFRRVLASPLKPISGSRSARPFVV